jgi:cyclic pyranopterin phosphate synthase
MNADSTHLDEGGRPRMVDVGDKQPSDRRAVARGRLQLSDAGWQALQAPAGGGKGDPLSVGQLAAIQGAKRCAEWIPLAHPLPLDGVAVRWQRDEAQRCLELEVEVRVHARTGVEMEALTAVAAGLLSVYDMLKSVDRSLWIEAIWLAEKEGGRSGHFQRDRPSPSRRL